MSDNKIQNKDHPTVTQVVKHIVGFVTKKQKQLRRRLKIKLCDYRVIGFNYLKLCLMLYFLYGIYYSETGKLLFDEPFVREKWAPVALKLKTKHNWFDPCAEQDFPELKTVLAVSKTETKLINAVLEKLYQFSAFRLLELNCEPDNPFTTTEPGKTIDQTAIMNYFGNKKLQ